MLFDYTFTTKGKSSELFPLIGDSFYYLYLCDLKGIG